MPENVYTYLKFVRYKELENWSVSHILGMNMGFNEMYPMISIGNVIKRSANAINIEDDIPYKQITLKTNGGGAVLRDVKQGKSIGTKKQFVVSAGQFIMSKIDARNGAFGVVGTDLDGAVVTADFPVFDVVKDKVTPEYLALISSTAPFVKFAQSCSRGTTNRQRIDVGLFLSQKIPLPTIDEQRKLVSAFNNKISQSEVLEKQAAQVEQDIEDYLLSELGIKQKGYTQAEPAATVASEPQVEYVVSNRQLEDRADTYHWGDEIKKEYQFLKFVRFKDVERWDIYNNKSIDSSQCFPNIKLSQIVQSKPQYGAGFSSKEYDGEIRYIRITDINDDGSLNNGKVSADGYSDRYLLKENDFLIARSGNTVGKTFLYKNEVGKSIYAGYLIKFELNTDVVIPEYLLYYTKSSAYKNWINGNMRISAQPNINSQQYMDSPVILPPIDIQNSIVEHINKQKEQIKRLRQQAESLRKEALEEFEKKIFE
ncbi:MAG: restriction endonuclease subunit S [Bacteroidales bacterium]|nr:restriction endonuclease subunit S [Bacteroidales bacterium]